MMQSVVLLMIGLLVGALSGVIGIGGGVLIVPALVYLFGMTQHRAQGTSLAALLAPVGALAYLQYRRAGGVDHRVAAWIAAGFLIGGWFGGGWAQHISELWLRRGFGALMLGIGIKLML